METQRENEILGVLGAKLKNRNLVLMAIGFILKMEARFKNDIIKTALEKISLAAMQSKGCVCNKTQMWKD